MQGVQAQTVANFSLALESDLAIVPVLNKIDLKTAQPDVVAQQMNNVFGINTNDILKVLFFVSLLLCLFLPVDIVTQQMNNAFRMDTNDILKVSFVFSLLSCFFLPQCLWNRHKPHFKGFVFLFIAISENLEKKFNLLACFSFLFVLMLVMINPADNGFTSVIAM